MSLIPIPNNSDLTTYFTTGQRKALDTLGDVIADGIINYITANPNVIQIPLDGLTDVDAPSPVTGDNLQYDGVDWVAIANTLNNLTNVNASSPNTGDTIVFDGTDWESDKYKTRVVNLVTPGTHELDASNANSFIGTAGGGNYTLQVQADLPIGTFWEIYQGDTSTVTITGASGVAVNVSAVYEQTPITLLGQYAVAGVKCVEENIYVAFGNLTLA